MLNLFFLYPQDAGCVVFFEKQATMSLANVAAATSYWHSTAVKDEFVWGVDMDGYGPPLVTHEFPEIFFDSLEFLFRTFWVSGNVW